MGEFPDGRYQLALRMSLRDWMSGVTSGPISDVEWVRIQLDNGASVKDVAAHAGVSVPTARSWIRRHGLAVASSRPLPVELRTAYAAAGSVAALGRELRVSPETARQWLIDAGIELRRRGRPVGLRLVEVDIAAVRPRRAAGQSLRVIAADLDIDRRTLKKLLGERPEAE